ncbi:conserved hypothetical protein [Candida albicans WO-1]|uniref:Uncharacterized protein n=1 Tax=Candida albicans (strain WO-1) TaxID=294748 RepID=C4YS88_CANAW|nr:conserved hypothetical protein [Candida albicans WO-1]KGU24589.1 hypothetical protein MGK_04918 [Candida albicans P57055]
MIPSMTIDQLIESKWYEAYESYSINHNLPIDKTIKSSLPSITQEQQQQQQQQQQEQVPTQTPEIDLTNDIPNIIKLINKQSNVKELSTELTNVLLKYYWAGFDTGYECCNSNK